ncbi:MBL fold metallo-hydrolase [Bradyrhizobium sp. dw_411]|uniref:MBL fold metallo-hydrolase RNA specificity domain-containing protein n=1 Tax=Bradyrhizobium sp. dw_411 TaxID=2720082 RepID=UPI001BCF001A
MVECAGKRILVDCGLYQGSRELDQENAGSFGFDAASIDYVLLTHAHLDHCGRLPLLTRRGFRGEIITTSASRELTKLVVLDAAYLMEENARRRAHRGGHAGAGGDEKNPLYSTLDALNCLDNFGRTATYSEALDVTPGVSATFIDAGHILGSASIFLQLSEQGHSTSVLFSGDLGNAGRLLLRSPAAPPRADNVVMETTYGDRLHKPLGPSIDELFEAITENFKRGGNVIIPTFAVERAQELLYFLSDGIKKGKLAKSTQVFLDSPMAISATEIFRHHPECLEPDTAKQFQDGHDPFGLSGLHFTREAAESMALNNIAGGAIIMAGSGMCTGGRVRHHLQHNLGRNKSAIVFVGYAATGTLARRIIDGAKQVKIFGEEVPVRARIYTINGFSAHADQAELLAWQSQTGAKRTFLVHGEQDSMTKFAAHLRDTHVEMPVQNQSFEL